MFNVSGSGGTFSSLFVDHLFFFGEERKSVEIEIGRMTGRDLTSTGDWTSGTHYIQGLGL